MATALVSVIRSTVALADEPVPISPTDVEAIKADLQEAA